MKLTVTQLKSHVDNIERRFDKEIIRVLAYVYTKDLPIHDYITKREGYEEALKDASIKSQIRSGDIVISKQAWWLIVKVVGFVGTALAIIIGMINANK
jgi:hypothetical protein